MAAISGSKDISNASNFEVLTKDLEIYTIAGATGIHTNPSDADSIFHKTLRAISSEANVVMVGTPAANDLTVVLEGGYAGVKGTGAAAQLKAVIDAATGTTTTVAFGGERNTNVEPQFRTKKPRNIVTNSTQSMFAGARR